MKLKSFNRFSLRVLIDTTAFVFWKKSIKKRQEIDKVITLQRSKSAVEFVENCAKKRWFVANCGE